MYIMPWHIVFLGGLVSFGVRIEKYLTQVSFLQLLAVGYPLPDLLSRLVSACTHSISRYIHIQTLCVHKWNVLRFLQHGTYHIVVRGGSHFCQSPKGGGSGVFSLKRKGGPTLFWEKIPKFPSPPPPPEKKSTFPYVWSPARKWRLRLLLSRRCAPENPTEPARRLKLNDHSDTTDWATLLPI